MSLFYSFWASHSIEADDMVSEEKKPPQLPNFRFQGGLPSLPEMSPDPFEPFGKIFLLASRLED